MSQVKCHMSPISCHMSHITYHLSLMPTATNPHPANYPTMHYALCTMHSRLVWEDQNNIFF